MGASIKEKQKLYKDRLDDHEQIIQDTNKNLSETKRELHEKMGLRVKMLEAKMNTMVPAVDQLKAGMELTEEYWKGLSHGLRESHKMVAVDQELIRSEPRALSSSRGKALPVLPRSPQPTSQGGDVTPMGRGQDGRPLSSRYQRSSQA